MYKLVVLFAVLALSAAAPKPGAILTYSAPLVASVVQPAVSSYSSYSSGVVHGSPLAVVAPAVRAVPVVHQPLLHSVPIAYSSPVHTVLV